jgi:hypothetical protein
MSDDHTNGGMDEIDPIDVAYAKAEALLGDDEGRLARRARVLAAVAKEAAAQGRRSPGQPKSIWRGGPPRWAGAVAAACVAGLCLLVVTNLYQALERPQAPASETKPPAAPPTAATSGARVTPPSAAASRIPQAPEERAPPETQAAAQRAAPSPSPAPPAPLAAKAAADVSPAPVPPPPIPIAPVAHAAPPPQAEAPVAPSAAVSPQQGSVISELVITPQKRSQDEAQADRGELLRAAASAGDTRQVKALLAKRVPVDAADADGETPLMKAVKADQPETAALLIRRHASLDLRNAAGQSARDMAQAIADPALNRALGLEP